MRRWFLVATLCTAAPAAASPYLVGAGQHDITGPAGGLIMMGYVKPDQKTAGISTRLRARAFIVADPATDARVVFVTVDRCQVYQAITQAVVAKLKASFGDLYTEDNVLISATHTHSAPAGDSHYQLYRISTLGFSQENFDVTVDGIHAAIAKAHANLVPGTVRVANGDLVEASLNRSPEAYRLNPAEERARYPHDTDKRMTVLRLDAADGTPVGMIDWYAVHVTSMPATNHLISADNKGYAAQLFERAKGTDYAEDRTFVAAFANSNAGDASPMTAGQDLNGDGDWDCVDAEGFACTRRSGQLQYDKAMALYDGAADAIVGPIDHRHAWVDFSHVAIDATHGEVGATTCAGAIGLSMLAGAEDHRGVGYEGRRCSDGDAVAKGLCLRPRADCQGEKPVAMATGQKSPPWTPQVLPLQILRIGQLALVAVPAEFTTMSGRRLRDEVQSVLGEAGVTQVVLAGYANAYAGYVATREEYQRQDYEGASTHFGEWTLAAYQQEFHALADAMRRGTPAVDDAAPLDLTDEYRRPATSELPADALPRGKAFGDVLVEPKESYRIGEVARARFQSAHPSHDMLIQSSFLEVQRWSGDEWVAVMHDWDEETKFIWEPGMGRRSTAMIEWRITDRSGPGRYRLMHRGVAKDGDGDLTTFTGASREFSVGP